MDDIKRITCIVCPNSCRIEARKTENGYDFTGYRCKRGLEHAEHEMTNPMRMLTSTVLIEGASLRCLPVISTAEVPKKKLKECLAQVYKVRAKAPVREGDVIIKDVCGTGVDVIAARSMEKYPKQD